jgi:hypothetical protein
VNIKVIQLLNVNFLGVNKMDEENFIWQMAELYSKATELILYPPEQSGIPIGTDWKNANGNQKMNSFQVMKQFLKLSKELVDKTAKEIQVFPNVHMEKEQNCLGCGKKTMNAFVDQKTKKMFPACVECAPKIINQLYR